MSYNHSSSSFMLDLHRITYLVDFLLELEVISYDCWADIVNKELDEKFTKRRWMNP
jgi:hypothetical protein